MMGTLYNILFSLKNLHKNDTEKTKLFIENPSCSSTEPKIKSLVEHHTTMGLKALTSVNAQRNINALISSQHELAPLSKESILEAIQELILLIVVLIHVGLKLKHLCFSEPM